MCVTIDNAGVGFNVWPIRKDGVGLNVLSIIPFFIDLFDLIVASEDFPA